MTNRIRRLNEADEYWSDEGCFILELSNSSDDEVCSIARARVLRGATTQPHQLAETVERYVIVQGQGIVSVAGEPPEAVAALDVVIIPEGIRQSITNTGTEDLIFLCVCTPRFKPENYQTSN